MKNGKFLGLIVTLVLCLTACGKNTAPGQVTQNQIDGNQIDTVTSSIILPADDIHFSSRGTLTFNEVNGPSNFQGMHNLIRSFRIPARYQGGLHIGSIQHTYSNCRSPANILWNVRFYLVENGFERPVPSRFYV